MSTKEIVFARLDDHGLPRIGHKRLPLFIQENTDSIVREWENFARSLTPSSTDMTPLALRDHIQQILEFTIADMESSQTADEQTRKSRGGRTRHDRDTAAETHAAVRLAGGFDIGQMTSEYRALRASVIKLWSRVNLSMDAEDISEMTRFNEAIDQQLSESVNFYLKKIVQSKDLFVGILSHDLRSPVQSIMLSAELATHAGGLNARQDMLNRTMYESAARINVLIGNLIDVTKARFGSGLPVVRAPMDMGFVGHQIVGEVQVVHPGREFGLRISGNLRGEWDKARIGQVFSNLLGNAIQYSFKDSAIDVTIVGTADRVTLTVHNDGVPIAPDRIKGIFSALTREADPADSHDSLNLGLGLFITEEVVLAHGGTIQVASSEEDGTLFTVVLPR